jgi:hypothetical protein
MGPESGLEHDIMWDLHHNLHISVSIRRMRKILYGDFNIPVVDIYATTIPGFRNLLGSKLSFIVIGNILESCAYTYEATHITHYLKDILESWTIYFFK